MTKKKSQRHHTKKRAIERFGIDLTHKQVDSIIDAIQQQSKSVRFVERQSNRITIWKVDISDITNGEFDCKAIVCYDRDRKSLATIMSEDLYGKL